MKSSAWDFGGDIVHNGGLSLKPTCFSFFPAAAPLVRAAIIYGPEQRKEPGPQHTRHKARRPTCWAHSQHVAEPDSEPGLTRGEGPELWGQNTPYSQGHYLLSSFFFFYALVTCCDFEMSLRTLNEKLIADDTLLRFLQTRLGFWILCRYLNQSTDPVQSSHLVVLHQGTTKDKLWLYSHVLSKTLTSILRP